MNLGLRLAVLTSGILTAGENSLGYRLDTRHLANAWLALSYAVSESERPIECRIQLVTTRPHFGGIRCWFLCPLVVDGTSCTVRARKLYLPLGGRYFGCRRCYGLTYASCQQHDKRFDAVRRQLKEVWA